MIEYSGLYNWQKNAYNKFKTNNVGICECATGTGKTMLGLYIIQTLNTKTIIVVPTIAIMLQWKQEILKCLDIDEDAVGLYCGMKKEFKKITVAVINSIRHKDLLDFELCVLDEIHRYGSDINFNVIVNTKFKYRLGLTAILRRIDKKHHNIIQKFAPVIYEYSQANAIKDKILCNYNIYNVAVNLLESEKNIYEKDDYTIKELMPQFNYDIDNIFSGGYNPIKTRLRRAITRRRNILCNARQKIDVAAGLIIRKNNNKIIVFCEYIKTSKEIANILEDNNIKYGIYHSKINQKDKNDVIDKFKNNQIAVLLSVKALDEGLNVPDCNVGIIVAGSKTERQIIQRLGRILRKKDVVAKIYQLYIPNTKDEQWLYQRLKAVKSCNKIIWI